MANQLTITTAARKMSAEFREVVQTAAGNATLTKAERERVTSPWAKQTIPNKRMSVDAAMDFIKPKILRALQAVSTDGRHVTPTDVSHLRVADLRHSAEGLFTAGPKMEQLKSSLDKADVPQLTDYGHSIGLSVYGADQSLAQVMEQITGNEYARDQWTIVNGAGAITDFNSGMRTVGDTEKRNLDEDPANGAALNGDQVKKIFDDIARDTGRAFRPSTQFKSVKSLSHSIAEDGDVEYQILLAQKKDNTWVAITYSDFPF